MAKPRKPIEPILRENILRLADACQKARGIKPSSLSGEFHGDPKFLEKLKAGKCSFTARKYDTSMLWFDAWFSKHPEVRRPAITDHFMLQI